MEPTTFQEQVRVAGATLAQRLPERVILVGDYDTDGIASIALLQSAFTRANVAVTTLFTPQVDQRFLDTLAEHEGDLILFADIGATTIGMLQELQRQIIVLDHHQPDTSSLEKLLHLNPLLHGLEESNCISSAGIAYFFALGLHAKNKDLAPLAFLGALGDMQERQGLSILNNTILQYAVLQGTISVQERLKLFGLHTRTLLKVLTYSTDLQIPGVTNNFHGAKKFLHSLDIHWRDDRGQRTYVDLTDEEKQRLEDAILERKRRADLDELYQDTYTWTTMPEYLSDMKELATMINACGRLGEFDVALDALQGNVEAQEKLKDILHTYKKILQTTFQTLQDQNVEHHEMWERENFILFYLADKLPFSMAGIIASMLARNNHYPKGMVIGIITDYPYHQEKLSLRISQDVADINLAEKLSKSFATMSTGGHPNAAGAIFDKEQHEAVIATLLDIF